jgi:hypothetical protein
MLGLMPHPEHAVDPLWGRPAGSRCSRADRCGAPTSQGERVTVNRDSGEKGRQAGAICCAPTVARVDAAPHGHATRLAHGAARARGRGPHRALRDRAPAASPAARDAPSVA